MYSDQRQRVLAEAATWLGTPYHLNARLKGIGVDCGTFLMACFANTGLILDEDVGPFSPDFHLHRGEEIYFRQLEKYCHRLPAGQSPLPGDIATYQFGRIYAHGALVVEWPKIIHVHRQRGVIWDIATDNSLSFRQGPFWSYWGESL